MCIPLCRDFSPSIDYNTPFTWTDEHQAAFLQLKHAICSALVLRIFDPDLITTVNTDASGFALVHLRLGRYILFDSSLTHLTKAEESPTFDHLLRQEHWELFVVSSVRQKIPLLSHFSVELVIRTRPATTEVYT